MRTFFIRSATFVACGLVILVGLYALSNSLAPVQSAERGRLQSVLQDRQIRALSVGNSHNLALSFDAMGVEGRAFWSSSEDYFESAYKLDYVLPQLENLRCVFLPMSFTKLYGDNSLLTRTSYWRRQMYGVTGAYDFTLISGDVGNLLWAKRSVVMRDDHWFDPFARMLGFNISLASSSNSIDQGSENLGWYSQTADDEIVANSARRSALRHMQLISDMQRAGGEQRLFTRTTNALHSILERADRHGVTVILYTPPYPVSYTSSIDRGIADELRAVSGEIAAQYDNAIYVDYSLEPVFTENYSYFRDDHMNLNGATAFSTRLADDLNLTSLCR